MIKLFIILALVPVACIADQIVVTRVIKPSELIIDDDLQIIKSQDDPRSPKLSDVVAEFAMLSDIVAKRLAFAASPATLAFNEEEIVMNKPFNAATGVMQQIRASS